MRQPAPTKGWAAEVPRTKPAGNPTSVFLGICECVDDGEFELLPSSEFELRCDDANNATLRAELSSLNSVAPVVLGMIGRDSTDGRTDRQTQFGLIHLKKETKRSPKMRFWTQFTLDKGSQSNLHYRPHKKTFFP